MAPHSSTLAWKIPWTEEPGRLQSMWSLRVAHNWATSLSLFTFMHWRRKWQPTPVSLPGESQGQGSLVGCHPWDCTESTWLKQLSSSSSGHCWVFQIYGHIECSTFTASSFRIWKSSIGIKSPLLSLFIVMLPKAHLILYSTMSDSKWVISPVVIWVMKIFFCIVLLCILTTFLNIFCFYHVHIFLYFIVLIFTWNIPLVSRIFLKRSLVFPVLLFFFFYLFALITEEGFLISPCYSLGLHSVGYIFSPLPFTSLFS